MRLRIYGVNVRLVGFGFTLQWGPSLAAEDIETYVGMEHYIAVLQWGPSLAAEDISSWAATRASSSGFNGAPALRLRI